MRKRGRPKTPSGTSGSTLHGTFLSNSEEIAVGGVKSSYVPDASETTFKKGKSQQFTGGALVEYPLTYSFHMGVSNTGMPRPQRKGAKCSRGVKTGVKPSNLLGVNAIFDDKKAEEAGHTMSPPFP